MVLRIDLDLRTTCGAIGTVSPWRIEDWVGSLTELDLSLRRAKEPDSFLMMEDWELDLFLGVEDLPFPPLPEGSRLVIIPRVGLEPLGSGGTGGLCSFLPLVSPGLSCGPSGSFVPGSEGSIVGSKEGAEKRLYRPGIVP